MPTSEPVCCGLPPVRSGEVPKARAIVPAVNRLATALRDLGGHVVWVKNATNDTRESWSIYHDWLQTPERRDRRQTACDAKFGVRTV